MSNPYISVIMGVYNIGNQKEYFEKCINSINNQTYKNWECIICDDGSTDDTWKYINKICGTNKKFKIIRNDRNSGLRVALNQCIRKAEGYYLIRQDADDYSEVNRFEVLVNEVIKKDLDVLGCGMKLIDENGQWGVRNPKKENPQKKDFLYGTVVSHATCIIKRESILKVNGYREAWETMRCEDYDLFMRMAANDMKFGNIKEPLYCVREDSACYSRKKYINRIKESVVRFKGYRALNYPLYAYIFVLKPLIVGLIPSQLMRRLRQCLAK